MPAAESASSLVLAVGMALRSAPDCVDPFYTPHASVCGESGCNELLNDTEPFASNCHTPLPKTWQQGFVQVHTTRRNNVPPSNVTRSLVSNFWKDGGLHSVAIGQGWSLEWDGSKDLMLSLGGTCGAMCAIAARVGDYLKERFSDVPPEEIAVLDIGAGTSTLDACLASVEGIGVTVALTPLDAVHLYNDEKSGGGEYWMQTYLSVERGSPTLTLRAGPTLPVPVQAGSFHSVFACRASGGALLNMDWFWIDVQRVLKPGGVLLTEGIRQHPGKMSPAAKFCMKAVEPPGDFTNRFYTARGWAMFKATLSAFVRLPLSECNWTTHYPICNATASTTRKQANIAFPMCLTPDSSAPSALVAATLEDTDVWGAGAVPPAPPPTHPPHAPSHMSLMRPWDALVESMEPWLKRTPSQLAELRAHDELIHFKPPPGQKIDKSLSVFPTNPVNSSRAVTVLDIHAADHGFVRALRARATRWWGISPASVHPMFTTPHTKSSAPSGAVVHDLCYRPLATHPRGFDIILLNEALLLAKHCARRREWHRESSAQVDALRHFALELLRLIRPGEFGIFVLGGGAELEFELKTHFGPWKMGAASDSNSSGASEVRAAFVKLNLEFLGCVAHGGSRACMIRRQ